MANISNFEQSLSPWLVQQARHLTTTAPTTPHSPTEIDLILSWTSLIASIAIFWNGVVLISSTKYHAIRLDKVSIILIRNLAISDLGYGISMVFYIVNIATGENFFGKVPCYVITMCSFSFLASSGSFLATLNSNKLISLLFPLQSTTRSYKRGYIISIVIWVSVSICHLIYLLVTLIPMDFKIEYNHFTYKCAISKEPKNSYRVIFGAVLNIVFTLTPTLTIVVTTLWMIKYVMKVRGILKQGVVTLLVVSMVFCLSILPAVVYFILRQALSDQAKDSQWFTHLYRVVLLSIHTNSAASPLCYLITIKSFGAFVKMKLREARVQFLLRLRYMICLILQQ